MPGSAYSHQAQLTSHGSRLYATWSLGIRDEEAPGQRMVIAESDDLGRTWSQPVTVAPSNPGRFADSVVVSSGVRIHDGSLIAYYGEWERDQAGLNPDGTRNTDAGVRNMLHVRTEARLSHDGGRTWSESRLILPRLANYFPPAAIRGGRLIFPGNLTYPYTDDATGLTGWQRAAPAGIPDDYVDIFYSMRQGGQLLNIAEHYSEACFFQTDDNVIHMLLRCENGECLGVTESHDNGLSWSLPRVTFFTDNTCRAHGGRLPDGRFFVLSCPVPTNRHRARSPMVLAVSNDGVTFDRHFVLGEEPESEPRMPGLYKHGRYGYPYLHIVGDLAFVIYSINKEDIAVGRFDVTHLI